jgi:hypothetical protein
LPKTPQNIACAVAIPIVYLHDPILMPDGEKQITVIRGIHDGVGVCPVRKQIRVAVDIQVAKSVSNPNRL